MGIKVGKAAAAAAQVVWPRHEEGIEVGGGEKEAEKVYKRDYVKVTVPKI